MGSSSILIMRNGKEGVGLDRRFVGVSLFVLVCVLVGYNMITDVKKPIDFKNLVIEKQIGTKGSYKKTKKITDQDTIEAFYDILVRANWENAKVSMEHPPSYRINNLYDIWITPQHNQLEIIINGKNKYTKLTKKDSKLLFEMMVNKKWGETQKN